jgi:hypothetical protein
VEPCGGRGCFGVARPLAGAGCGELWRAARPGFTRAGGGLCCGELWRAARPGFTRAAGRHGVGGCGAGGVKVAREMRRASGRVPARPGRRVGSARLSQAASRASGVAGRAARARGWSRVCSQVVRPRLRLRRPCLQVVRARVRACRSSAHALSVRACRPSAHAHAPAVRARPERTCSPAGLQRSRPGCEAGPSPPQGELPRPAAAACRERGRAARRRPAPGHVKGAPHTVGAPTARLWGIVSWNWTSCPRRAR